MSPRRRKSRFGRDAKTRRFLRRSSIEETTMMLGEQERREWERYQVVFWTIQDVARERIMARVPPFGGPAHALSWRARRTGLSLGVLNQGAVL